MEIVEGGRASLDFKPATLTFIISAIPEPWSKNT